MTEPVDRVAAILRQREVVKATLGEVVEQLERMTAGFVALHLYVEDMRAEANRTGREDAARDIEEHAELAGWGEVWAQAVSIAKGIDLRRPGSCDAQTPTSGGEQ